MAGKLKTEEMRQILLRLNAANNIFDSSVARLIQSQKELSKATETQTCLNKSLKPMYAAFGPQGGTMPSSSSSSSSSGHL